MLGKKPSMTWPEAVVRWLKEMQHKKSLYDDISQFKWLQQHLNKYPLCNITKDVIESLAQKKEDEGVKPATVNRLLALIRSVLTRACKHWEWIDKTPIVRMRKEDNARTRWLTKEEADKLLAELPDHLQKMAKFTLATGLRASNVSYLEWKDIDIANKHLIIHPDQHKNKKAHGVPLNQDALDILHSRIGKHPRYVFTYNNKPVTQCSTRAWRNAVSRAGIKNFRWHDLRHTWASWHIQNGTTLQELFELGGWSSFDMVLRYAHLSSNHLKLAADRISGAKMVQSSLDPEKKLR